MRHTERLEVWQDRGGLWRWAYVRDDVHGQDGEPLQLASTEPALTREEALAAARLAYPDVPVEDAPESRDPADERPPDLRSRRWPWALATGALSLTLAGLAARYRRWGVVVISPLVAAGIVARLRRSLP